MDHEITFALQAASEGKPLATDRLFELVYDDLRRLASSRLKNEPDGLTLQATALVHEAYLRLLPPKSMDEASPSSLWENRRHFFAAAAEAMRRILIDNARRKSRSKHGGDFQRLAVEFAEEAVQDQARSSSEGERLLAMNDALAAFEAIDPKKAELVKLRYFAGLEESEAADLLGISRATAARHWAYAKAWLKEHLDTQ